MTLDEDSRSEGHGKAPDQLLREHEVRSLWSEFKLTRELENLGWSASQSVTYPDHDSGKYRELDILARRGYRREADGRGFRVDLFIALKSLEQHHIVVLPASAELLLDTLHLVPGSIMSSLTWTSMEFSPLQRNSDSLPPPSVSVEGLPPAVRALPADTLLCRPFREVRPKGKPKQLDESVLFRTHRALDVAAEAMKRDRHEQAATLVRAMSAVSDRRESYERIVDLCNRVGRLDFGFHRIIFLDGGLHRLQDEKSLVGVPALRLTEMTVGPSRGWTDVVALAQASEHLKQTTMEYDAFFGRRGYSQCSIDDVRIADADSAALCGLQLGRFD